MFDKFTIKDNFLKIGLQIFYPFDFQCALHFALSCSKPNALPLEFIQDQYSVLNYKFYKIIKGDCSFSHFGLSIGLNLNRVNNFRVIFLKCLQTIIVTNFFIFLFQIDVNKTICSFCMFLQFISSLNNLFIINFLISMEEKC